MVRPLFAAAEAQAIEQYYQLANSERASSNLAEIVAAAHYGRVDILFTQLEHQQWGTFNSDTGEVALLDEAEPGADELLDVAAVQTLLNGGTVYSLTADAMPTGEPITAIFRY